MNQQRQQGALKNPYVPETLSLSQYLILDDLQRFGVTGSVGHVPQGIFQDFGQTTQRTPPPPIKIEKKAPEAPLFEPQKQLHQEARAIKPKAPRADFKPENFISWQEGAWPFTVVMTIEENGEWPQLMANIQEQTLWQNILRSVDTSKMKGGAAQTHNHPSYVIIGDEAALDGNLRDEEERLLHEELCAKLNAFWEKSERKPKALLAVGGRAHRLLVPENHAQTSEKNGQQSKQTQIFSLQKGCKCPLFTIYQLQAMLRQPTLKRQTWATLIKLREALL